MKVSFRCLFTIVSGALLSILGISACIVRSPAQGGDKRVSLVSRILLHSPKRCSDRGGLAAIRQSLTQYHHHHAIFVKSGVRPDGISLPRQHSLVHYPPLI
jgi:hypothetical protein